MFDRPVMKTRHFSYLDGNRRKSPKTSFWWLYFDKNQTVIVGKLRRYVGFYVGILIRKWFWSDWLIVMLIFCPLGGPPSRTSPFLYLIDSSIGVIRNQSTFISHSFISFIWLREKCLKMKLQSLQGFRHQTQMIVLTQPSIHHQKLHG